MTILIVGASGATGRLVVQQLLAQSTAENETVRVIVRSKAALSEILPIETIHDRRLEITEASLLNMTNSQLAAQVKGCRAVVSCLGHNLSLNGMLGQPRRLVTDAVRRLCNAIEATVQAMPVKFILMNTTGNQNSKAGEKVSIPQAIVVGLIRMLLPPHADNEEAAEYLQSRYGSNQNIIEWVTVRPDRLINKESVTEYDAYESPIRSAIFDAGKTSRINVAHFMSQLIINNGIWDKWKNQMPVIYNN